MSDIFYLTIIVVWLVIYLIVREIFHYLKFKKCLETEFMDNIFTDAEMDDLTDYLIEEGIEDLIIDDDIITVKLKSGENHIIYTDSEKAVAKLKQALNKGEE